MQLGLLGASGHNVAQYILRYYQRKLFVRIILGRITVGPQVDYSFLVLAVSNMFASTDPLGAQGRESHEPSGNPFPTLLKTVLKIFSVGLLQGIMHRVD